MGTIRASALLTTALLLQGVLPCLATAQANAVLTGRALDFVADAPVVAAQIELLDDRQRRVMSVMTDPQGRFTFERVRAGSYQLRATSIGYRDVITPPLAVQTLDSTAVYEVIVWMGVEAVPLAPLEVVARARPIVRHPGLAAFFARADRRMGGRFMMREEIESIGPHRTTDLLPLLGVTVIAETLEMPRLRCAPTVYLDGITLYSPVYSPGEVTVGSGPREEPFLMINELIDPAAIEGIEVFPGASSVPGQFGGTMAACGVVSIWTRRW